MADQVSTPPLERAKLHRERLAEAADALERAVTGAAGDEAAWRSLTGAAVVEVGAALAGHVDETESEDGLFAEITGRSPRLAHAIERLRDEHEDLATSIAELEVMVGSPDASVEDIRESALALLTGISRHRHRGADLIWDSYNFDIGTGD